MIKLDIQMFADGKVIIDTELNTSKFEKQLSNLEKKYANKQLDVEFTAGELQNEEEKLNSINKQLDSATANYDRIKNELKEQKKIIDSITTKTADGVRISQGNLDLYNRTNSKIDTLRTNLYAQGDAIDVMNANWEKQNSTVEKLNRKYEKQKNDLEQISEQINNVKVNQMNDGFANMQKSMTGIINKVKKWGLALFGIRSAYMFIRQSMSTLSQYNQDLANKIQTIKVALATALEPIITRIVDWVYKLVGYLGYFIKRWTGFDIFKNSAKALKSGASSAKQIRKELAGFDEMNILGQNITASGGVSANMQNPFAGLDSDVLGKIDGFVEKLNELGITSGKIKDYIEGIVAIIGAIEVGKIVANISKIVGVAGGTAGLYGIVAALAAIDIYLVAWVLPKKIKETKEALKKLHEAEQDEMDIIIKGMNDSLTWLEKNNKKLEEINRKKDNGGRLTKAENTLLIQQKANQDNVNNSLSKVNAKVKDGVKLTESQKLELDNIKKNYQDIDKKTFKNDIQTKIEVALEESKNNDSVLKKLGNKIKNALKNMNWIDILKNPLKYSYNAKGAVYYPPKLASGGVINRPGRGIPLGSAIGGERGAEGVIPLTDSQQMALLGEAIGKYITINANITNTMNGRVISKELQKINAENDFAYNR